MQVKQAANVIELLEFFAKRQRPATLAEISEELGWPRSSAYNIIGTLAEMGYLYEPRARNGYYPSPRWSSVVGTIAAAEPLPEAAMQLVAELAAETGETTAIGGPAGTLAIFIHVVESPHPIRYFAKVGHKLPIQATSTGRAILAQYTPAERQTLYRRINFEKYSETTPTSIDAVETELRRSAERGYHQSNADYSADLIGVALPLPIQGKRLALVVAGPMYRCSARAPEIAATMKRAVARFAAELDLRY